MMWRKTWRKPAAWLAAPLIASSFSLPALAELKLCNMTSSRVGVAIGYRDKDGWTSEGWWNVDQQTCSILIKDKLNARFYYIYAIDYDKGGEWAGKIPMCILDGEFTIKGNDNCEGRKYKKSNFFEVDTLDNNDWTVKLTEQTDPGDAKPAATASAPTGTAKQ
jgi:uncharacterized membrane protein